MNKEFTQPHSAHAILTSKYQNKCSGILVKHKMYFSAFFSLKQNYEKLPLYLRRLEGRCL